MTQIDEALRNPTSVALLQISHADKPPRMQKGHTGEKAIPLPVTGYSFAEGLSHADATTVLQQQISHPETHLRDLRREFRMLGQWLRKTEDKFYKDKEED